MFACKYWGVLCMKWSMKALKRLFAYAVCMTILFASAAFAEENAANIQPVYAGIPVAYGDGEDQIELSKTLAATEWENLFEVTLNVRTQKKISELVYGNTAVVVVLDISNTMNSAYSTSSTETTRIASAREAAQTFAEHFLSDAYEELGEERQLGFVTFNTHAQTVIPLMTQAELAAEGSSYVKDTIGDVIAPADDDIKFTNIEGGLRLAHNILKDSGAMFKHVILLTDGFPTTYADTGKDLTSTISIAGYNTYDGTRFINRKLNKPCTAGTDYSDEGATRAQNEAAAIREDGIYLHTVGVDIGGQTIQAKLDAHAGKAFSTVDCYATGDYVIGSANSTESYRNWLSSSISGAGTGSAYAGQYASCDDASQFEAIYDELFRIIREVSSAGTEGLWVAADSMGELIELRGMSQDYPTVTESASSFEWSIMDTAPVSHTVGDTTYYDYEVKYYVRLENEDGGFSEGEEWPTNGPTWFDYRVVETVNGEEVLSEVRRAEFDVPAVEGYLTDLVFDKKDGVTGVGIEGAGFTLTHDHEQCEICRGIEGSTRDQGGTQIGPFYAESDANGTVTFTNLPSGHEYVLQETQPPAGYQPNTDMYGFGVHYDQITEHGFSWDELTNLRYNTLTVSKQIDAENGWDDPAFAPEFTVQLQKLNEQTGVYDVLDTVTLAADESHTFTELLKGNYRVVEIDPEANPSDGWEYTGRVIYTVNADGTQTEGGSVTLYGGDDAQARIVNQYAYTPDTVSLTAYKRWEDGANRDGIRPASVRFALLVNGVLWEGDAVKDVTAKVDDHLYAVTFEYDSRRGDASVIEIGYTDRRGQYHALGDFDESGVFVPSDETAFAYSTEYTVDENGNPVVVNTHASEVVSVRVWKTWDKVPENRILPITVRLYADGVEVNSVVLDGSEKWYYAFTQTADGAPLYKYENGREIIYRVTEDALGGGYVSEIHPMAGDRYGWLLVNSYHPLPLTGDDTQLWLLSALLVLSLTGMALLLRRRTGSR